MNSLVKTLIVFGLLIAGTVFAVNHHKETRTDYEYELAKAAVRAEYLERSAAIRALPDAASYEEETRALFKWYFGELTEVYNRFPKFRGDETAYLRELDDRRAKGKIKDEEYEQFKGAYEQAREVYELIKAGKYQPAMTAVDGGLRIDFLEFETGTISNGDKGVKGRFVLWGAQRRRSTEKTPAGATSTRVDVQAQFGDMQLKLKDAKDKDVGEASFGLPAGSYVPHPERFLKDFPPMAYVGRFEFPLMPFVAVKAEIEGSATTRTGAGRDLTATFKWTRDIPESWRLKEGEEWKGAEVEEREDLGADGKKGR